MKRITISLSMGTFLSLACALYFGYIADGLSASSSGYKPATPDHGLAAAGELREPGLSSESPKKWLPAWGRAETRDELRERLKKLVASTTPTDKEILFHTKQIRARLKYQQLYRELGLSAGQIEKFEAAAAQEFGPVEIFDVVLGQLSAEEQTRMLEPFAKNLDKVVRATLGDAAVPMFRDYVATRELEEAVSRLGVSSFNMGAPLTAEQKEQLLLLCAENCPATGQEIRIDARSIDWTTVEEAAAKFLTPPQLEALRRQHAIRAFDAEFTNITELPSRRPVRGL